MVEIVEVCDSIEKYLQQQCVIKCRELCSECSENDCSSMCRDIEFYSDCVDYMVMAFHAELDELDEEDEEEEW